MSASIRTPKRRPRERGAVLAMTGIAMIMIVGMAVIGVDVGHLAFTANEVQTLADLSATSYARTLAQNWDDGGSRDPVAQTEPVVQQNMVGGVQATIDSNIESFEPGHYDNETRVFQVGGAPVNAVRATAVATVPNFFAGMFGDPTSTVTRQATAALTPPGRAPVLPLAIGECFWDVFESNGSCSEQPAFSQVPSPTDNSCWTSLTPDVGDANADWFRDTILRLCGLQSGGTPRVGLGDTIGLSNGQVTPALQALRDCVNAGVTEFVVPVIPCNQCNQTDEIIGFATIDITQVVVNGPTAGVYAGAVCSTDPPGATGGGTGPDTGTVIVSMVE